MTHEEFVLKKRAEVGETAKNMLSGKMDYLEGAINLSVLLPLAELESDFSVFLLIRSETDSLPIGEVKELWSENALVKLAPELEKAGNWAREISLKECASLAHQYGN